MNEQELVQEAAETTAILSGKVVKAARRQKDSVVELEFTDGSVLIVLERQEGGLELVVNLPTGL